MSTKEFLKNVLLFNIYIDKANYDQAISHLEYIITIHGDLKPIHLSKLLQKIYQNWTKFNQDQQDHILELLEPSMRSVSALKSILIFCKHDVDFCAKVISKIIKKNITNITKELFHYIIGNEVLMTALKHSLQEEYLISKQLSEEARKNLLNNILYYAIDYNDYKFIEFIENLDKRQFNEIKLSLPIEKQFELNKIVSKKSSLLSKYTREFSSGFGNVSYEGGLLTCAQIAQNKSYKFDPIIFKDIEEFEEFISFLGQDINYFKDKSLKFAISGSHWISGMIEFDSQNKMQILLMDSLGEWNKSQNPNNVNVGYEVSKVVNIIQKYINMDVKIYYSSEQRQNSIKGCSIFALDDLRRFYTIQENLPTKYSSLFDFYEKNGTKKQRQLFPNEESTLVNILDCKLPAHFKKTKQSSTLIQEIKDDEEFNQLKNKHGKTPLDSIATSFKEIESKTVNKKLDSKLEKHALRNVKFLYEHNDQDTIKIMNNFSFQGFKEKVQSEKEKCLTAPSNQPSRLLESRNIVQVETIGRNGFFPRVTDCSKTKFTPASRLKRIDPIFTPKEAAEIFKRKRRSR